MLIKIVWYLERGTQTSMKKNGETRNMVNWNLSKLSGNSLGKGKYFQQWHRINQVYLRKWILYLISKSIFCSSLCITEKTKKQVTDWYKIFVKCLSGKGPVTKLHNGFLLVNKTT